MIAKKETHVRVQPIANGDGSEDRLLLALEEYSTSVEAGQPLTRESILAKYSDVADELSNCLDSLEFIREVAPQLGDDAANGSSTVSKLRPLARLGDFRILRELGRGGMGVVYEAEQLSLGRRIALKVLPFAAMLDKQQLARFKNEARAAATLDHPNIVAIYSVGSERGVHYYAMQLIEGRSLAEIIAELKSGRPPSHNEIAHAAALINHATAADTAKAAMPTVRIMGSVAFSTIPPAESREYYRTIARLGIQAAEALDHAHQNGILHRDIKPANLLLDDEGKLWIADFGLARIEQDAGMTMTGDLLGTLRYMAPEQALAKRIVIDHRADVYSLGATLYELLTLQPAFGETDRSDLLKQIAFEEPRALRKIDPHIPTDLETIVLKAVAKDRDERYQSSQHLADDLKAYLDQRPIAAKPPTYLERASKWSRRHVGLVRAALVSLLVVLILSTVSAIVVTQLYREADAQRLSAEAKTNLAERERRRAELLLATAQLESGIKLLDQGQPSGLLDLVDARLTAGDHPVGQSAARLWAAAIDNLKFRLVQVLPEAGLLCFSPDGHQLATTRENTVHVRDVVSGRELFDPLKLEEKIHTIVYSPDGSLIAAHSWRGMAQVWNAADGKSTSPLLRHEHTPSSDVDPTGVAAFSPDGKLFATGGADATIRLWDVGSWQPHGEPLRHDGTILGLAFLPDRKGLVSLSSDNVLHLWDIAGKQIQQKTTRAFNNHFGGPLTVSPNGKWIFHLDARQTPAIIDAKAFQLKTRLDYHGVLVSGNFSPDDRLFATAASDWTVRLWNAETGQPFGNIMKHTARVPTARFNHKGNLLASGSIDRTVVIWDTETQRPVGLPLYSDGMVPRIEFSPRDDFLVFNGWKTSRLWKIASESTTATVKRKQVVEPATPCLISPNGKYRATITENGGIMLSKENSKNAQPIMLRQDFIRCAAFNLDSTLLATGADDWFVNIWEASTGRLIKKWNARERVYGMAFSPIDAMTLVTAQFDGTARLWNVATKQPIGLPMKHDAPVWEVAFDPSGQMLATASGDEYLHPSRIRLWDIGAAAPYPSVALPFRPTDSHTHQWSSSSTFETFDKDGGMIVRDANDGRAREWQLPKPPSDAYAMRNTTWLALGIRRSLEGTNEAIGAGEWQKLRDERSAGDKAGGE